MTAVAAVAAVAGVVVGGVAVEGGMVAHRASTVDAASGAFSPRGGPATSIEEVGVVDITTVLDFGTGQAAGTGIVLTSSGEILTNNHVIDGATAVSVADVTTGRTYTATVVGTDPTDDIAVLQLADATGLATAPLASAADEVNLAVGASVTAVGNAGGTGGTPTAAPGTISAVDQDITAGDESGTSSEQLTGLIEVAAAVQAGDSGGPLYAGGVVIGIDTAADSGNTTGFAIPVTTATAIADRIEAGEQSSTIHQGTPAFLGVELFGTGTATIAGVTNGSAAAALGLGRGDTITAIDGTTVTSGQTLSTILGAHHPRDRVSISWTDTVGTTHTSTTTVGAGPAD